jgi:hypothetical protein
MSSMTVSYEPYSRAVQSLKYCKVGIKIGRHA